MLPGLLSSSINACIRLSQGWPPGESALAAFFPWAWNILLPNQIDLWWSVKCLADLGLQRLLMNPSPPLSSLLFLPVTVTLL